MCSQFQVYACVRSSDAERLRKDLATSPEIASGKVGLTVLWDQESASGAYARAIETATADVLIFTHCDVFFPDGWFKRLKWEVGRLSCLDANWAIAGISSKTQSGELVGRIFDTSLEPIFSRTHGIFGKQLAAPVPIVSTDGLVVIVLR